MISKYDRSLSKAVGPADRSFLVVKKSHLNKKYLSHSESTSSIKQKVQVVNIISFAMCQYTYAYKCLCQCVGEVYYPNVNFVLFYMLGPIISENDQPFLLHGSLQPTNLEKKSEALR